MEGTGFSWRDVLLFMERQWYYVFIIVVVLLFTYYIGKHSLFKMHLHPCKSVCCCVCIFHSCFVQDSSFN